MRKLMRRAAALFFLVLIIGGGSFASLAAADNPTLAVSPFNNLSGNQEMDYVGFQISEYLTTAYGAFDNITLVERSNLVEILQEQELQLSGMTDAGTAVKVGEILNARYLVLGSFSTAGSTLRISARVTDVETGQVVVTKGVDGRAEQTFVLLRQLFYGLVAGMKASGSSDFAAWDISVPVEARVASLEDQGEAASQDFARALEASFKQNDEEALSLLSKSVSGSQLNFTNYAGAADKYLETYKKVQKIETDTFFTRMLQRQIDTNKKLLGEAEEFTLYRNTLKVVFNRLRDSLNSDALDLSVATPYGFEEGTVSMMILPPRGLSVAVKDSFKRGVRDLLGQQDILELNPKGSLLSYKKVPEIGTLLPSEGIANLFNYDFQATVEYSIQFVSPQGEVVYELVPAAPAVPFSISVGKITWNAELPDVFTEAVPRPGWGYRDGKVEVQARELQNLGDVRVVLKPDTFRVEGSFPTEQDLIWKSLIMHAYRQKYVKIAGDEKDPCPQVKEAVVTDFMITFPGYDISRVPLLVNKRPLAWYADLTGVVYWADSSHTLVEGVWGGGCSGKQ